MDGLIGIGLYTPAEAGRLLHVAPAKISRWLRGHTLKGREYPALWTPAVKLDDAERTILGFRDLMEIRVADAFIRAGVSSIQVRAAIDYAREVLGEDYPLSAERFRTDGRSILLRVFEKDADGVERERLLNLFRRQYEFKEVIDPLLKTVDFDDRGSPRLWYPAGRRVNIVVDPLRSFGQPIDGATSVPTAVLAMSAKELGVDETAIAYDVPEASVRRAIDFEHSLN
ncbi:hypothetical protein B5M44_19070 [Shinella sumterensis]|uniref:hypothetical protein n=1 Tax=Shinella sumterensis TaxID=1967501 RepID=UPI00106DD402|nr:hypothetical protein [Shinella sumterensis]MCD1266692.1 hypothetical protein [Shinella sumterensis]MDP9590330.1 uncharacterized protein (DUF433 family) [Shinella zoogloeoides]TFE96685.1 hypothetical protein B5M44_19070 [Shinella sumterensis]